jgi:hypothetical protein
MQLTTFCWKQLRITLLRVYAMYFIRIYLSGTQHNNTIQYNTNSKYRHPRYYVIGIHKSNDVLFHKMLSSSNQCNQSIIIVLNSLLIVLPERAPFILYAINDILLKTVKNNIVACLCNVFYTNLSFWNTTQQYNTIQYNSQYNTQYRYFISN